jgi:DNA-binding NarL/FixJ family response regulator
LDACLFRHEVKENLVHGLRYLMQGSAWMSCAVLEQISHEPASPAAAPVDDTALTRTEKKVLALLQRGLENEQIAAELLLQEQTVRNHVYHIYQKLGMNRLELVARR